MQDDLTGKTHAVPLFERDKGAFLLLSGNMAVPGAPPSATDRLEILTGAGREVLEIGKVELMPVNEAATTLHLEGQNSLQESFDTTIAHLLTVSAMEAHSKHQSGTL